MIKTKACNRGTSCDDSFVTKCLWRLARSAKGVDIGQGTPYTACRYLKAKRIIGLKQNALGIAEPLSYCTVGSLPEITALSMLK